MKRRSFFQALTAGLATLFLPPIRAAKAVQSRVRRAFPRSWLDGKRYWEHLETPTPAPRYIRGAPDAKIVCRVLGPTHFNTPVQVRCEGCKRKLKTSTEGDYSGWEVDRSEGYWVARCPDHPRATVKSQVTV